MEVSLLSHGLAYGIVLSLIMTVIIVGSLYVNPRFWLQDYPEPIRDKLLPLTAGEKRAQRLLMLPFLAFMIGIPLYAVWTLKVQAGGLAFLDAFVGAFVVLNIFNLVDAVIINLLLLAFLTPKFAIPAGAGDLSLYLRDWGAYLANYLESIVLAAVLGLVIAAVVTLLPL